MVVNKNEKKHLVAEHPDLAVSEDFLNMEDPPAAKEMKFQWEPSQQQQRDRYETGVKQGSEQDEDPEGKQRRVRAHKGVPDFNRRPSFEYEDYKKNAYNRLSMFDSRH